MLRERIFKLLTAMLAIIAMIFTAGQSSPAHAQTQTTKQLVPRELMVQGNDLANLNSLGTGYTSDFTYITCGGNSGVCSPGDINSYTSEAVFAAAIADGTQPPGSTALLDLEPWDLTPASESAHIEYYDKLATEAAIANGINLILSPVDYVDGLPEAAEAEAAYAGAGTIIEIQSQGHDATPTKLYDYVDPIVKAIRAQNKTVPIMIGLATDAGGWNVISGTTLYDDYLTTYGLASAFWLNAATWTDVNAKPCAATGCPVDGDAFLDLWVTGATSS